MISNRLRVVVSLLVLSLALVACWARHPGRGVDLGVVNHVDQDFILSVEISSEKGERLATLSLPVHRSTKGQFADEWRYLDAESLCFDFERLAVRAVLVSIPDGAEVDRAAALWPGGAGMSSGAGSNRIFVVLQIRSLADGSVQVEFDERGFI
jgi:hypothetical protein